MKFNLYVVRNKLSGTLNVPLCFTFATDLQASIELATYVKNRLDEFEILKVATLDFETGECESLPKQIIAFNDKHLTAEVPPTLTRTGSAQDIEQSYINDTSDIK